MSEMGIDIFKKGSTTYYYSSKFFPDYILKDVTKLYAFVRKADDYVDQIPQKKKEFYDFKRQFNDALKGKKVKDKIVRDFVELFRRKRFEKSWVDAFFHSMELDTKKNRYKTIKDLDEYLYGSAEVVGLMMSNILGLKKGAYTSARYLGKGMQYINYIRDIDEDVELNRIYFPMDDLAVCGIKKLDPEYIKGKEKRFNSCIRRQIERYFEWIEKAEKGFDYIPRKYLIPIKTATDMYIWTAKKIYENPSRVYEEKIKPSKYRIIWYGFVNTISPYRKLKTIKAKKKIYCEV
jgi:phytoene synthase